MCIQLVLIALVPVDLTLIVIIKTYCGAKFEKRAVITRWRPLT